MKIATFNVNGVNGRLPVLLRWLDGAKPDVLCLQELKAPQDKFPEAAIREAGYGAIWLGQKSWNGVAILARGADPVETRRGLPGEPTDLQSRYIEARINDVLVGCLYLPNGNPAPGPRFDYKLRWFERLTNYAADLLAQGDQVVLAGDFNVMPTDLDVYKPERWVDDALFRPEVRAAYRHLVAQGLTDALRKLHPDALFGITSGMPMDATPACALTIYCSVRRRRSAWRTQMSTGMCGAGKGPATVRRHGLISKMRGRGPLLAADQARQGGADHCKPGCL